MVVPSRLARILIYPVILISLISCSGDEESVPEVEPDFFGPISEFCTEFKSDSNTGASGTAYSFIVDPITSSGEQSLSPLQDDLDQYAQSVSLQNLKGEGVLNGNYVDVRNGIYCLDGYGAYNESNDFGFSRAEPGFAESMTYYYGDRYRAFLDQNSSLLPTDPMIMIAHCEFADNAYYLRAPLSNGSVIRYVCLGNSIDSPGATYAEDASVTTHELQHATTIETYSPTQSLNQFWFDEAGSLNEALSDFMSLLFLAPERPASSDPRLFSPWALGRFIKNYHGVRGAHRCPEYDSSYPDCLDFGVGIDGFSSEPSRVHVSYVYPDGVGWPYANNFSAPSYLRSVMESGSSFEAIHSAGMLIVGFLWDVYERLKDNRSGDHKAAANILTRLVHEAIRHLPKPNSSDRSPVTFIEFASQIKQWASVVGLTSEDIADLDQVLESRGLDNALEPSAGWLAVGPGVTETPGMRYEDQPITVQRWAANIGGDPAIVTQDITTSNDRPNAGETAVIWFDVQNLDVNTVGGLLLRVQSLSDKVSILSRRYNDGAISPTEAHIRYFKVPGTGIVSKLNSSSNPSYHVDIGNHYFAANPGFDQTWRTGIWIKIASNANSGEELKFNVEVVPAGFDHLKETVQFSLWVQ